MWKSCRRSLFMVPFILRIFDPFLPEMVPFLLRNFYHFLKWYHCIEDFWPFTDWKPEMVPFLLTIFDPLLKWYNFCWPFSEMVQVSRKFDPFLKWGNGSILLRGFNFGGFRKSAPTGVMFSPWSYNSIINERYLHISWTLPYFFDSWVRFFWVDTPRVYNSTTLQLYSFIKSKKKLQW